MKNLLKSAFVGAALLASGSVFASNMGFKLVKPLSPSTGGTNPGWNWVSVPYFNNFATAMAVYNDITPSTQVLEVDRYDRATDSYQVQDGFSPDFAINKGEAVRVIVTTAMNWTIVGSHDNAFPIALLPSTGGTNGGLNWISIPYHTTQAASLALYTEINQGTGRLLEIDRYDRATNSFQVQDGFSPDFAINIGEGMLAKVTGAPGTPLNWTPAHY